MKRNRNKDKESHPHTDMEPRRNRYPVEKGMNQEACEGKEADRRRDDNLRMGFLAEVEMRGQYVFRKMDQQITGQNEQRRMVGEPHALRNHAQEGSSQHKADSKGDEIFEQRLVPALLDRHQEATRYIRGCSGGAKDQADIKRVHYCRLTGNLGKT